MKVICAEAVIKGMLAEERLCISAQVNTTIIKPVRTRDAEEFSYS
jgi:hypothetical protein